MVFPFSPCCSVTLLCGEGLQDSCVPACTQLTAHSWPCEPSDQTILWNKHKAAQREGGTSSPCPGTEPHQARPPLQEDIRLWVLVISPSVPPNPLLKLCSSGSVGPLRWPRGTRGTCQPAPTGRATNRLLCFLIPRISETLLTSFLLHRHVRSQVPHGSSALTHAVPHQALCPPQTGTSVARALPSPNCLLQPHSLASIPDPGLGSVVSGPHMQLDPSINHKAPNYSSEQPPSTRPRVTTTPTT